ncbi:Similar to CG32809: Coiled-coil domain-containing protein CG32809 (Drosophila melanogaster), partial [Cotesia congregata]
KCRNKPTPPPKPMTLKSGTYMYRDLALTPELYNQLRGLQKKAKDLRQEVRNLRRMSQAQAHSVREAIKDTFITIRSNGIAISYRIFEYLIIVDEVTFECFTNVALRRDSIQIKDLDLAFGVSLLTVPMSAVAVFISAVKAAVSSVLRPISRRTPPRFVCLIDFMSTPVSVELTLALISLRRSVYVCLSAGCTSTVCVLVFFLLGFLEPPLFGWFWASVDCAAGTCSLSFFFPSLFFCQVTTVGAELILPR